MTDLDAARKGVRVGITWRNSRPACMADIIMANRRIAMRKIRQVLRLALEAGASRRRIAKSLGLSRDVVTDYLTRAVAAGLAWPLSPDLDDAQLENLLFPPLGVNLHRKPEPDWAVIHQEMKRKGATLQALHEEFLAEQPDGIGYSLFCDRYRDWQKGLKRYMRQTHVAGERAFVDYAGPTVGIPNPETGKSERRKSSSESSAPRTIPMLRLTGVSNSPTGSRRTPGCSSSSAACRRSWSATT